MRDSTFVIPVLDPERFPVRGMRSSVNPATLGAGEFSDLVNVRLSSGTLKVRPGIAKVGSSPQACPANNCLAAWGGVVNGSYVLLTAWNFGSVGRIYEYSIASGSWTELTAGSGAFGNTRMAASGGPWSFATVRNPLTGQELVLIQNGEDLPRAYSPASLVSLSEKVAIHQPISAPTSETGFTSTPRFPVYFNLQSAGTTSSASGANFTLGATGTSPDRHFELVRNTTSDTNPTVTLTHATSLDLSNSRQLILLTEGGISSLWLSIKVEILTSTGTAYTVFDPSTGSLSASGLTLVPDQLGSLRQWVAFGLDAIDASLRTSINRVRLTWVGSAPQVSQTLKVLMVAGSGRVLGLALHCISYANETSGAESPGTYISQIAAGFVRDHGGPVLDNLRLAHSPLLYYAYTLTYLNPTTAERDRGTQSLVVYRNDLGEPEGKYAFVSRQTLCQYASGWSYVSGSAMSLLQLTDDTPASQKALDIEGPDGFHQTVPSGKCMLAANGRLLVGAKAGNTVLSPQNSHLWVSDAGNPLRFRSFPTSETSGTRLSLDSEYPVALAMSSSTAYGENAIWFITTRRTYRLGGYSTSGLSVLRMAAPHGSYHAGSVQELGGELYLLTTDKKVLRIRGGALDFISDMHIEDKLDATYSAPWNVTSAVFNRRYLLGVDGSGNAAATLKSPLIYESRPSMGRGEFGWSRDDYAGEFGLSFFAWHPQRCFFVGSNKYLYEIDAAGTSDDEGTDIESSITSREFFLPDRRGYTVRSVRTLTDQGAGGSVTHEVRYRPNGTAQTATAPLTAGTSQSWVDSGVLVGAGNGPFHGIGVQLTSTYTLPAGSEIFSTELVAEYSDLEAERL